MLHNINLIDCKDVPFSNEANRYFSHLHCLSNMPPTFYDKHNEKTIFASLTVAIELDFSGQVIPCI